MDRLVRYVSLGEEKDGRNSEALKSAFEKEDMRANAALYILLRAVDRFQSTYSRFPGSFDRLLPCIHLFAD